MRPRADGTPADSRTVGQPDWRTGGPADSEMVGCPVHRSARPTVRHQRYDVRQGGDVHSVTPPLGTSWIGVRHVSGRSMLRPCWIINQGNDLGLVDSRISAPR